MSLTTINHGKDTDFSAVDKKKSMMR